MNKKRLIPLISILLVFSFIGLFFFYKRRKGFGSDGQRIAKGHGNFPAPFCYTVCILFAAVFDMMRRI